MANFRDAFEDAIRRLGYGEAPERQLTRAEVSARAREIAAAEGIKYKSARRRIERHRTTGREARGQPNRRFARRLRQQGVTVHAELEIDVSPRADEEDMRPRTIDVSIPGDALDRVAAALDRADLSEACSHFYEALFRAYEEADEEGASFLANAAIGDVDALDIAWGGGEFEEPGELPF